MYSKWRERLRHTLGFRLALWYAAIFVVSSLALTGLTYLLVAASLRQYDREIIGTALVQYASAYQIGGVAALQEEIQRTQATAAPGPDARPDGRRAAGRDVPQPPGRLARLRSVAAAGAVTRGEQTWSTLDTGEDGFELEVASVRLRDGTLFQVGMSTERRAELLQRFRRVLLVNVLSLIFVGLAGGAVADLVGASAAPAARRHRAIDSADRPHRRARARAEHRRRARRAELAGQRDARSHRRRPGRHARRARQRRPRSAHADDAAARDRRNRTDRQRSCAASAKRWPTASRNRTASSQCSTR